MKKKLLLLFSILLIAFMLMPLSGTSAESVTEKNLSASNGSSEEIEDELENNIDENLNHLDMDDLQKFIEEMGLSGSYFGTSIKVFMQKIIKGEFEGGFSEFMKMALSLIGGQILDFIPVLITIIAIAIIFSIIDGMSSGFLKSTTHEIIYFVCYSSIIILMVYQVMQIVLITTRTVKLIQQLMNVIFPILLTMMTALGGVVSVTAYQPMLAVLSVGVVSVITKLIIPCFIAAFVFSIVGNLSKNIKLDKMTRFFKSFSEFTLGLVFSLFMTFVTVQGITGSIVDNISVRSAKFAISSYVPILGGYLSDGFDLILASCVLVKNAVGVTGILILVLVILSPVLTIAVFSLGLKLTAGIIEPLCDKRISDMIFKISKNINILMAIILGVGFMFLIIIMLMIFTANMGVV